MAGIFSLPKVKNTVPSMPGLGKFNAPDFNMRTWKTGAIFPLIILVVFSELL